MRFRRVFLVALLAVSLGGCTLVDGWGPGTTYAGPGSLYESYLAGSSTEIVVEIDHAPGANWDHDTPAEEHFVQELERITQKDVEVRYKQQLPARGADYAYALDELRDLHSEHLDHQPGNGTEVVHALFVDGRIGGNVAGIAFEPRAFALFKGEIRDRTCGNDAEVCHAPCPDGEPVCADWTQPTVREWKVTRSVAIHEAGHLLGLVNSPLPMVEDHEMVGDPKPETEEDENRSHSSNDSSVMWWAVENVPQADDFADGGEVPWRFGELDVRDARAVQAET